MDRDAALHPLTILPCHPVFIPPTRYPQPTSANTVRKKIRKETQRCRDAEKKKEDHITDQPPFDTVCPLSCTQRSGVHVVSCSGPVSVYVFLTVACVLDRPLY